MGRVQSGYNRTFRLSFSPLLLSIPIHPFFLLLSLSLFPFRLSPYQRYEHV